MVQAAVKAFLSGEADELLDDKMYKHAESQDFPQSLVRYILKSSTLTVPVTRNAEQQAKTADARGARPR